MSPKHLSTCHLDVRKPTSTSAFFILHKSQLSLDREIIHHRKMKSIGSSVIALKTSIRMMFEVALSFNKHIKLNPERTPALVTQTTSSMFQATMMHIHFRLRGETHPADDQKIEYAKETLGHFNKRWRIAGISPCTAISIRTSSKANANVFCRKIPSNHRKCYYYSNNSTSPCDISYR
jgi:hypothetical protein